MSRYKSKEKFEKEVKDKFPNIEVLSDYTSSDEIVSFHCLVHDFYFTKKPIRLLHSVYGCDLCANDKKRALHKTDDEYSKELESKNANVIKIGKYTGSQNKILVECKSCLKCWLANPEDLLRGHGCGECSINRSAKKRIKTQEEFLSDVCKYNPHSSNFDVISDYSGLYKPVKCECKECGNIWEIEASRLVARSGGSGCPNCRKRSRGELEVIKFFNDNSIEYIDGMKFDSLVGVGGLPLSYDFYIPSKNILIEIQGEQHYKPVEYFGGLDQFKIQVIHDNKKRDFAYRNGFQLIEIRNDKDSYIVEIKNTLSKIFGII